MNFAIHTLERAAAAPMAVRVLPPVPRAFAGSSLAVSLIFHSAIAMATLSWHNASDTGVVPEPSDAISIEMATTAVMDAMEDRLERRAAAPSVASAASAVSEVQPDRTIDTVEAQTMEAAEPSTVQVQHAAPDHVEDLSYVSGAGEPAPAHAAPAEPQELQSVERTSVEPQRKLMQREKVVRLAPEPTQTSPQKESPAKPSVSRAGQSGSTGQVSASRGDILSYAARVRARVAGRKPAGNGVRGTVIISFSVTRSGGLGGARIAASSGSSALDSAALSAVQGAGPFPPPPGGAGSLSFSVPFHYR